MLSPSGHAVLADHGIAYDIGSSSGDVAEHGRLTEPRAMVGAAGGQ